MATEQGIKDMQIEGREVEGSLRVFKFPEILQFLSMGKRTGTLLLTQDERRVELSFKDGKIINVVSRDRYISLGQMLVYSGHITRESLNKALELQQSGSGTKYLGEILIEQGLINLDQLKSAIRLQLEEELWELFSWETGNFRFDQGAVRSTGSVEVELDVASILQEGNRRMQEWQVLRSNINDPSEIFQVNPEFSGPPEQPLEEKTWRVLSLINGRLPVEALVRYSNLGKFETYWALDHLQRTEIIVRGGEKKMSDRERMSATIKMNAPHDQDGKLDVVGAKDKKAGKGVLGIFGKRKGSADRNEPEESNTSVRREFLTDVALVCGAVNALLDALQDQAILTSPATGPDWIEWMWKMAEQRFPRADIIRFAADRLSADLYDRYSKNEGAMTRALNGIHDDCLAALRLFWNRLEEKGKEAKGEAEINSISDRIIRNFAQATASITSADFAIKQWIREGPGALAGASQR